MNSTEMFTEQRFLVLCLSSLLLRRSNITSKLPPLREDKHTQRS